VALAPRLADAAPELESDDLLLQYDSASASDPINTRPMIVFPNLNIAHLPDIENYILHRLIAA